MSVRRAEEYSVFASLPKRQKCEIHMELKNKCPGCIYDDENNVIDMQPNQLAHMDPPYGCLYVEYD